MKYELKRSSGWRKKKETSSLPKKFAERRFWNEADGKRKALEEMSRHVMDPLICRGG
jgi:hypothetical protein